MGQGKFLISTRISIERGREAAAYNGLEFREMSGLKISN